MSNNVDVVYITLDDPCDLLGYQSATLKKLVDSKHHTSDQKVKIIHNALKNQLNYIFDVGVNETVLAHTKESVQVIVEQLVSNEITMDSLMGLISHNHYTYSHSVNVCIYALSLAREINLDEERLISLANGAILHDLGKTKIDPKILTKPAQLTDYEMEAMFEHPYDGVRMLHELGEADPVVLDIVGQHHLKLDGSGYGIKKDDNLSVETQIVTLADIFDALSTERSYKDAMPYFTAFKTMKTHMNEQLNIDYLNKMIRLMGSSAS